MDNPLETLATERYLDLLAAQLCSLPPDVQAEQREEVRLHLQAMAVACQELGSGAGAAEREARAQFGDPVQVGRFIARRYWPPDILPGSFALAFGTALVWLTVFYGTISGVFFLIDNWYISTGADTSAVLRSPVTASVGMSLFFVVLPLFAGWLTALAAPKYAAPAMLVAVPTVLFGASAAARIPEGTHFDFLALALVALTGGLGALGTSRRLQRKSLNPRRWLSTLPRRNG